jgi:hypothetical protein
MAWVLAALMSAVGAGVDAWAQEAKKAVSMLSVKKEYVIRNA